MDRGLNRFEVSNTEQVKASKKRGEVFEDFRIDYQNNAQLTPGQVDIYSNNTRIIALEYLTDTKKRAKLRHLKRDLQERGADITSADLEHLAEAGFAIQDFNIKKQRMPNGEYIDRKFVKGYWISDDGRNSYDYLIIQQALVKKLK